MAQRLLALATMSLLAACDADSLTQLIVIVDTDLPVPDRIAALEIQVDSSAIAPGDVQEADAILTGPESLPEYLTLVHREGPLGPMVITARGLDPMSMEVVARQARVSFVRGETRVLRMDLVALCVSQDCPDGETCVPPGTCRGIDVGPEELEDWTGDPDRLDAAAPPPDAPELDGGPDAQLPDGGEMDACLSSAEICNGMDDDCDGMADEGFDVMTDTLHCGRCDNACPADPAHAAPTCVMGSCGMECEALWGDCDSLPENGCETPLNTRGDCGACGSPCTLAHSTASCILGFCQVGVCSPGWDDCDGLPENGCEAPLDAPETCGACTLMCMLPGTDADGCLMGACTVAACTPGYGDCDGTNGNGCETDLTAPADCGACDNSCSLANAVSRCDVAGAAPVCAIDRCVGAYADCDMLAANGCETPTDTLLDCGGCGTPCALPHATASCATGSCVIERCDVGFEDCNGLPGDGCESDLSDTITCGDCTTRCMGATPRCGVVGGVRQCVSTCSAPTPVLCGASCVNTMGDPSHCGMCDRVCTLPNATAGCSTGACTVASCDPGFGNCDGSAATGCEEPLNSLMHCNGCSNRCDRANATASCSAGTCEIGMCDPTYGDCDGIDGNGCEARLNTVTHCGGCDIPCARDFATASCATGTCVLGACDAMHGNCDGEEANGCETSTRTLSHCGGCGAVCDLENATESCTTGTCALTACNEGWGNCDGTSGNGCETPTATLTDCGSCGVACSRFEASATCATGTCAIDRCNPMRGSCDGVDANGCETNLATSMMHCGMCGRACGPGFECRAGSCYDLRSAIQVVAGDDFTCILRANGTINCVGRDDRGQQGNGSSTMFVVSGITDAVAIAAGDRHACAVRRTGQVMCWGDNARGQLGDGTSIMRTSPVMVSGLADAVEVAAGNEHTCARRTSGAVSCWGRNNVGQIGDDTSTDRSTPVPVYMLLDAVEIGATGGDHTCARRTSGAVQCWGRNDVGQLGVGDTANRDRPTTVSGLVDARDLGIGEEHSCAVRATGAVVCWGKGGSGELGNDDTNDQDTPVPAFALMDAVRVAAGYDHTCATRTGSTVVCWGLNANGQLGVGDNTSRDRPTAVLTITDAVQIGAGERHSCAVRSTGGVWCWGANDVGQLIDGTTTDRNRPVMVLGVP